MSALKYLRVFKTLVTLYKCSLGVSTSNKCCSQISLYFSNFLLPGIGQRVSCEVGTYQWGIFSAQILFSQCEFSIRVFLNAKLPFFSFKSVFLCASIYAKITPTPLIPISFAGISRWSQSGSQWECSSTPRGNTNYR